MTRLRPGCNPEVGPLPSAKDQCPIVFKAFSLENRYVRAGGHDKGIQNYAWCREIGKRGVLLLQQWIIQW